MALQHYFSLYVWRLLQDQNNTLQRAYELVRQSTQIMYLILSTDPLMKYYSNKNKNTSLKFYLSEISIYF